MADDYKTLDETALHGADLSTPNKGLPPPMDVRFTNLSLSVEETVATTDAASSSGASTLPTLPNVVIQGVRGLTASKTTVSKPILENLSGVFKPGTMTLVLGQPGSGKSSLMKILSGRFRPSKATTLQGEVTYSGATSAELRGRLARLVSYVPQRDCHFPTLTVKETLAFAYECCGGELPAQLQETMTAEDAPPKSYADVVGKQLGLEDCQDTVVGDDMLRGVSGGERKRVTTGEMLFGDSVVAFMDETTTGLDSAAAYDIVKMQRRAAQTLGKTVVISLLQPTPEVFALFDSVLLLNQGRAIYHGPRERASSYFEGLGFVRPVHRDMADFLLDIGTHQQSKYEKDLPAGAPYPRTASEFADAFGRSVIHQAMLADVHAPHDPQLINDREDYLDKIPEFHQSFWEGTMTLARQQAKVTWRNVPFIASRVVMVVLMGLINGSAFWQIDPKEAQVVLGLLFQAVLFISFGQSAQIPTFLAARDVFYKQRSANFYRTSCYVMAFSVNQLPISILETLVFGSAVYWMCGLASSFAAFVIFEVLLLLTSIAFTSLFFFFAACSPNLAIANPLSLIVLTFVMLYGGFAISETQMPDALVWIYWINPFTWVMRGLAVNQYRTAEFEVPVYDGIDYFGQFGQNMSEYSLRLVGMATENHWVWLAIVYIIAMHVVFLVLSWVFLEFFRFEQPESSAGQATNSDKKIGSPHSSTGSEYTLAHTPRGDSNGEIIVDMKPSTDHKVTPVTLAFKDLWYTVPNPQDKREELDLLKGISGYAMPGTITALMGSSGAGKTTLMDVIAGRKTGSRAQGQVWLNGFPATPLAIQRSTGYCEQMDFHSEASTFREALTFSAFLRQGDDTSECSKNEWVEECLDLLDLRPVADKMIRDSSPGQMKRLTIGVELAARQSVLFLDEPTTGLDARSAKLIMESVRKVANTGVTVVCTIHQPSAEVFQVFDSLLLLKRGGSMVFFGEVGLGASELVNYLECLDGVQPLQKGENPATWMLEAIGAGVNNSAGQDTDFAEIFNQSTKKAAMEAALGREGLTRPLAAAAPFSFSSKRAASTATQIKFLLSRFIDMHWRTASYDLVRIAVQFAMGLIFAVSFCTVDYQSYQGVNGGLAMIFMTTFFSGFIVITSVIPVLGGDRAAFYRERASQSYSALWYFVAAVVTEIPFVFLSAFLFTAVLFPSVGFVGVAQFFHYWLTVAMFGLMMTFFGMFLTFWLPSPEAATGIGILCMSIWGLFVGFNPPASAIPKGYNWLHQITPHRYTFEALSTIVLGNCDESNPSRAACKTLLDAPPTMAKDVTVSGFLGAFYGMSFDHVWRDFFAVVAFMGVFGFFALVSLRYVNHMKR